MANIPWNIRRNLENSLTEFLQTETAGKTVFFKGNDQAIDIRVGFAPQDDWSMPVISLYMDTRTAPRAFLGNNKRFKSYLMIIDVRALDDGMRSDLVELLTDTINDGFDLFDYSPNPSDPLNPIKVLSGKVSVDFVTDNALRATENANIYEKYRQNISISLTIAV